MDQKATVYYRRRIPMLQTYSLSYSHSHFSTYACTKYGYSLISESFGRTRHAEYQVFPYSYQKPLSKPGWAYSLSYTREFPEKTTKVFHSLGDRVRSRFSRNTKPIDHLGGLNPEKRLLVIDNIDRELEKWPKLGTTFEDMDVVVY
jgi:hypothetical protein